jgi:hypothetical protein
MRVQYVDVRRLSVGSNMALLLKPPCAFESEFLRLPLQRRAFAHAKESSAVALPYAHEEFVVWRAGLRV